jgi:High-affinity nickel-transport protein
MFGLDDWLASYSDGAGLAIVALVAIGLGLRHATDPDHLAAVSALIASARDRAARRAATLGLAWGLGHALTLFAFGLPIVLFEAYLPERVQRGAETTIGLVIVFLAVLLLLRWRRGAFHGHVHVHEHGDGTHLHVHSHERGERVRTRSARSAFGIGLLHGMGGSAGVGVLLVATIENTAYGVVALGLLAAFTAVSMAIVSTGFGAGLTRAPMARLAPALGATSLAFGVWYALGALSLAPYYF